jgi:phosphoserine phosphatase
MSNFSPYDSMEFLCRDPFEHAKKLGTIALDGPDCVSWIFDYDCTLTEKCPQDTNALPTSWAMLHEALSDEDKQADNELAAQYAHLEELPGGLTPEMALEWWNASLNLHIGKTNITTVRSIARTRTSYRPGAIKLLGTCGRTDMSPIIVSAGIEDSIKFGLSAATNKGSEDPVSIEKIRQELRDTEGYPDILANKLLFDDEGVITGWGAEPITSRNKLERAHSKLSRIRLLRPHTVLVGDSREDAKVVLDQPESEGLVLRYRVSDLKPGISTSLTPEYVSISHDNGYDAVTGSSLEPLAEIAERIGTGTLSNRQERSRV